MIYDRFTKDLFPFHPFTASPRQSHSVVTRGWYSWSYGQTETRGFAFFLARSGIWGQR